LAASFLRAQGAENVAVTISCYVSRAKTRFTATLEAVLGG